MKFSCIYIIFVCVACVLLFVDFFNQYISFKIAGFFLLMFSIYKLQSKISSKDKDYETKTDFVKQEKEDNV